MFPIFGIFDIFVFFKFLTSLKKNKRMLRYKGGTSVVGKQTSSKHMEHIDVQCKETCRIRTLMEIPPRVKVSDCKGKKCYNACT
jgi:hypothetical protein